MSEHSLLLTSPPDDVDGVHEMLADVWASNRGVPDADRMAFETAIVELASNVIQHGDIGDGVTWRLTVSCTALDLTARLVDDGGAADVDLENPTLPDALAESGRGLAFVDMLVDTLEHRRFANGAGNEWTISKRRSDALD